MLLPFALFGEIRLEKALEGVPLALTGLFIVFAALLLISLFLLILPILARPLANFFPEDHHAPAVAEEPSPEVLAALAASLHHQRKRNSS